MGGPKAQGPSEAELQEQARLRQEQEDRNKSLKEEADSRNAVRRATMFGYRGLMNAKTGVTGVKKDSLG